MCASGDILQAKLDDTLSDVEGVKTYIHDILVLIKESFYKNIHHIRVNYTMLHTKGPNVNAPKCRFGLKDITH